jgi:septum formation protein
MRELILTSQSPRRRQILEEEGLQFLTFPIEVSEILDKNLNLPDRISHCAQQKVMAALASPNLPKSKDILLLGADTVVLFRGQILGKPKNEQHSIDILNQLSGQVHEVMTGFCLLDLRTEHLILGHDTTEVEFYPLSKTDIETYVGSGSALDKAGGYGIQGEARKFVKTYHGSLKNVIGLPIEKIMKVISDNGWTIRTKS